MLNTMRTDSRHEMIDSILAIAWERILSTQALSPQSEARGNFFHIYAVVDPAIVRSEQRVLFPIGYAAIDSAYDRAEVMS